MTMDELIAYVQQVPEKIKQYVPDVIAETAVAHYKHTFTDKAWDGENWAPRKDNRPNSLMVDHGNLLASIKPAYVGADRVTISAGSDKVPYAQVHNEGFNGRVSIPQSWRTSRKGKKYEVKSFEKSMNMPKRQFLGYNEELGKHMVQAIVDVQEDILNLK